MDIEYQNMYNTFDELKIEVQKMVETIRKNLLASRPIMNSQDQLEEYTKRIQFASEIMVNLDYLVRQTFDLYNEFVNVHWEKKGDFEYIEEQENLFKSYDTTMTDWQSLTSKIERYNEITKNFM